MASITQSRDAISLQIYGRKFSQLSTDAKISVNKIWGIMDRTAKSGGDAESILRRASHEEAMKVVKQLKEIQQNPGDEITLPKGVMADAAKMLHYHYQSVGASKPLSKGDIKDIEREVKRVFGDVHPDVVEAVATYVSNPKGRFTGIGLKTLRNKLRSFLDAEEIAKIQDKQILSARDITISRMFDKITHGNLSSFVTPKLEDLMEADVKKLRKTQRVTTRKIPIEEVKQTIESLATLEKYQNSPSRSMQNPIIRRAMANLGISPEQVIGVSTKDAMGEVINQAHAFSSTRVKGHPSLGGGIRMRRNWKLHSRASSEYRESLPKKNVHSGIGRGTTMSSVPYKHDYSSGWKWDVPRKWASGGDSGSSSNAGEYLASELADYSYAQAEDEYGSPISKQKLVDAGPTRAVEHYTHLINKYAGSVTERESMMGVSRAEHTMHLQDIARYEHNLDTYTRRYGGYGKRLLEAGVPLSVADQLMLFPSKGGYRNEKIKEAIDWYSSGTKHHETPISVDPDMFNPFNPVNTMAGLYGEIPGNHPFMKSVQKFAGLFPNDSPAYLPEEVFNTVKNVATGKESIPGITRVGVVGSKSFDNKSMMSKWLKQNWDDSKLMVTSTEVGKSAVSGENIGSAFHASNWAHFNDYLQYKLPVRSANVGGKNTDMTTADVINASDEVVAFFDMAIPDRSAISQINKIKAAIGDKPLRVVWIPSTLSADPKMFPKDRKSFGMRMYDAFGSMGNVSVEQYHPGAVNKALSGLPLKMLAKGGALKSNEMAIVGEAGPELLVPSGSGGFDVLPNKDLRKLYGGTIGLSSFARNVTKEAQPDEHDYSDPNTGEIWPSVTKIMRLGKESNYGTSYYSDVGSVAHYHAAQALGAQHGIDVSHVKYPNVVGASETNRARTYHSAEDIAAQGKMLGDEFVRLANEIGFIPTMIEQRFVNAKDKYSGTVDIAGNMRDATGNLIPVIADFKSSTKFEEKKFAEQIGGYAQFFSNQVGGMIINVTRDMQRMEAVPVDIVTGAENFRTKLDKYNQIHGPRPVSPGFKSHQDSDLDDIFNSPAYNASQGFVNNNPNPRSTWPGLNDFEESLNQANQIDKLLGTGGTPPKKPTSSTTRTPAPPDYEAEFAAKYLGNVEHATGFAKRLEHIPAIGAPIRARRIREEYTSRVHRASDDELHDYAPKGYWKLIEKEEQARSRYFRSIRGATTSFLIAQHVMRVFGQTSKVYAKGSESVGKGLGYVMDMFLMPLVPIIGPLVSGMVGFGNIIRSLGPGPLIAGAFLVVAAAFHKLRKNAEEAIVIPTLLNKIADSIGNLTSVLETAHIPSGTPTGGPHKITRIKPFGKKEPEDDWLDLDEDDTKLKPLIKKLSHGINKVPGTGNKDTELALLTPGEMVLPVSISKKIRGYADGGVVGGLGSLIGGAVSAYGSMISSDVGSTLVTSLGMISKTVGSLMAPMAPVIAGGAIGGKGIMMVKNAIDRMRSSNESINGGGFGALRTMAAAQLVGLIGGLAPLLPIAAAIAGIYAWTQGFGATAGGILRGIKSVLDFSKDVLSRILERIKGMWDWFKELFKPKETGEKGGKPEDKVDKKGDRLRDDKLKESEEERRRRAREKFDKEPKKVKFDEITGEELPDDTKGKPKKGIIDKLTSGWDGVIKDHPMLSGVPGMTALGGVIGAMKSKDPVEWVKSAVLGGAAQIGFNALGAVAPAAAPFAGGFIAPDFAGSVADAIVNGEGPLSPSNYVPGVKGNKMLEGGLRVAGSTGLSVGMGPWGATGAIASDLVGGVGGIIGLLTGQGLSGIAGESIKSSETPNRPIEGEYGLFGETFKAIYNFLQSDAIKKLNAEPGDQSADSNTAVVAKLDEINTSLKQPTINNVTINATADAETIAIMVQHRLAGTGRASGVQRTF